MKNLFLLLLFCLAALTWGDHREARLFYRTGMEINGEAEVLSYSTMGRSREPSIQAIYRQLQSAPSAATIAANDFETFQYPCQGQGEARRCDFTATPSSTGHLCDGTNRRTLSRMLLCLERRYTTYSSEASAFQSLLRDQVAQYNSQAQLADRFNLSTFLRTIDVTRDGWAHRGEELITQMQARCHGNADCLTIYDEIYNSWHGLKNKMDFTTRVQRMRSELYSAHHLPWSESATDASLYSELVLVRDSAVATTGDGGGNGSEAGRGAGNGDNVGDSTSENNHPAAPGMEHISSIRLPTDGPPAVAGAEVDSAGSGSGTGPSSAGGTNTIGIQGGGWDAPIPISDCEFLSERSPPRCQSNGVFEGAPNEVIAPLAQDLLATSRPLLLNHVAQYMARNITSGYMQHAMLTPDKNIAGMTDAKNNLAAKCNSNSELKAIILQSGLDVINGVRDSFAESPCRSPAYPNGAGSVNQHLDCVRHRRHDLMIADAEEVAQLSHTLAALKADFPSGDMTPVSSHWPTWLPGSQTIARFMDMYAAGAMGLAENRERPCGFLQAGEIGQLMNRDEIHNPHSCPINRDTGVADCHLTSPADSYLVSLGIVSTERTGTAAERCQAKRVLMRQHGRTLASLLQRSPHLAAQVHLTGREDEVPVFEAIASADSLRRKRQILQEAYSLAQNQRSVLAPTEEYIESLCSDTSDVARDLFTNTDLLRNFLSCDGIAPLPVGLSEITPAALDGSALSPECLERRKFAAMACVIRAEANMRETGLNAGLTMMGMGFDALGVVGLAAGGAGLMSNGLRAGVTTGIRSLLNPGTIGRTVVGAGVGLAIGYPLYRRTLAQAQATSACYYAGECSAESYRESRTALRDAENGLIRDALIGIILDRTIDVHPRAPRPRPGTIEVEVDGVRTARPASPEAALGELRPGDQMVWRNPDGTEMRVTFDSFDLEAGLLRYFDRNGRVEMFIEDLFDDVGNGELRLIRSGVDGSVNFEVPVASYPRFTQMLTRLRERYNATVLHGPEGQAAIVEFMRARGITNPAEFPRAIFLPGRAPDFNPRIILSEGARLHDFMHEIRHLSQWRRALDGGGGAIGEVARRYAALAPNSPLRPTMQALSFYLDEIDASIYNRHLNAVSGNIEGVAHYTRLIDDEIARARELADTLPPGRERQAALDAITAMEERRSASLSSLPEEMRPATSPRAPPPVIPDDAVAPVAPEVGHPGTASIWERITPTSEAPHIGDSIPGSFVLEATPERIWIHPNATKHLREIIERDLARERPTANPTTRDPTIVTSGNHAPIPAITHRPAMARLLGQLALVDLEEAVTVMMNTTQFREQLQTIMRQMRESGEALSNSNRPRIFGIIDAGNGKFYEIGISGNPRAVAGEAPFVLYHAREVPNPGSSATITVFQGLRPPGT